MRIDQEDLSRALLMTALVAFSASWSMASAAGSPGEDRKPWRVPSRKARVENPVATSAESIALGKKLFARECIACHGETGRGNGPAAKDLEISPGNLSDPKLWEQTDGAIFWKISTGRSPMPTFEPTFSVEERWHIVNFVRTLAPRKKDAATAGSSSPLASVVSGYLSLQASLASDDLSAAKTAVAALGDASKGLAGVDASSLSEQTRGQWPATRKAIEKSVATCAKATDLPSMQRDFKALSDALAPAVKTYGHGRPEPLRLMLCPRAFDGVGALWIQKEEEPRNPYLGREGSSCGKTREVFPARKAASGPPE